MCLRRHPLSWSQPRPGLEREPLAFCGCRPGGKQHRYARNAKREPIMHLLADIKFMVSLARCCHRINSGRCRQCLCSGALLSWCLIKLT
mmetsp:Transcript_22879/g.59543  ORF Transcript_22879/g.59543 Transcript_22879/m.59543 type:complete len:89 (+) Transcript_22879:137-403(+)